MRLLDTCRRLARASIPVFIAYALAASGAGVSSSVGTFSAPLALTKRGSASVHEREAIRPIAELRAVQTVSVTHTVFFGAWVKPRGSQTHQQAVSSLEADIGRRLSIDHVYHGWDGPLIGSYERWSSSRGHALLINWKAVHDTASGRSNGSGAGYIRWADIAAGRYDTDLVARAREIKRFKKTVYLNFHHEPEDDRDLPGVAKAGTPSQFRAAWRHVRAVFRAQHVRNVRFVFILMGRTFRSGRAGQWYPGSSAVDVVGADAYNWFGTAHPGSHSWTTFEAAFEAAHAFAAARRKPLWVTETGTQEDPALPGRKAAWYRVIGTQVEAWQNLDAVIFFMGGRYGWYPDSSPKSLRAFRAFAHNQLFR